MTYKTKAQMQAEIAAQFPSGTPGAITAAILRGVVGDMTDSYNQGVGVNAQVGTSYTIQTSDYGQLVTFNNAAAIAVTIPGAGTAGFNPFNVTLANLGPGAVTVTPGAGNIGGNASFKIADNGIYRLVSDGTNYQLMMISPQAGSLSFTLFNVNFNSANTDNAFNVALPPGFSNYLVSAVYISGANHTLVTATCGVFTAAAGGGTAIVASASAITVAGTASGAANSAQSLTVVNPNTVMWSVAGVPTLFFRVQTAEGAAATASVTIVLIPVS